MSVDLGNNKGGYMNLSHNHWAFILNIAGKFGWDPEGVKCDYPDFDPMCYSSNDGQVVSKTDANKLADALEKAVSHVPNSKNNEKYLKFGTFGEVKEWLREYIKFFRQGEFQIT